MWLSASVVGEGMHKMTRFVFDLSLRFDYAFFL